MDTGNGNGDDLEIPDILKREGDKAPAPVKSEVQMSTSVETEVDEAPVRKPRKAVAKVNGASKAPAKVQATPKAKKAASKPAKAVKKAKAKAPRQRDPAKLDEFGLYKGSIKSQAAAMYASKKGATLGEVKGKLKSVQLNVLTKLEAEGYKVSKVKEEGDGPRRVTRYFLRSK